MPLSASQLVLYGCLGALLVEALKIARKIQGRKWPDLFDVVASVILIALGGAASVIYEGQIESGLIAAQLGASAPAIIGAWVSGGPPKPAGSGGAQSGGGAGGSAAGAAVGQLNAVSQLLNGFSWRV